MLIFRCRKVFKMNKKEFKKLKRGSKVWFNHRVGEYPSDKDEKTPNIISAPLDKKYNEYAIFLLLDGIEQLVAEDLFLSKNEAIEKWYTDKENEIGWEISSLELSIERESERLENIKANHAKWKKNKK